jgi:hypothetical protein
MNRNCPRSSADATSATQASLLGICPNHWAEPADAWDAILTMSVLDHIPDDAIESLAANMVRSAARYVIAVELWDGTHGSRGDFKYSRSSRDLFEKHGLHTLHWESSLVYTIRRRAFSGRTLAAGTRSGC